MTALGLIVTAVVGYFLGNLNGAILISKHVFGDDVRAKGSGNAGLTNFFRSYGGFWTLAVLLIDVGKTVLACFAGGLLLKVMGHGGLWDTAKMVGGFAAVLGHAFPVAYRFRGGKGILSAGTLALCMNPLIFVIIFAVFLLLVVLTHYVSLGSVMAAVSYPLAFWLFFPDNWYVTAMALCIGALAVVQHRKNLIRLKNGTESKTYFRKNHKE